MSQQQNTFILCPGQGAQQVGMGKDFVERYDAARRIFDRANDVLGFDLAAICFGGPEERLNQTDVSQPAIYVTSVACYHAAVAAEAIRPDAVAAWAGLSLGEYTALHLGGVFGFEDGLRLVAARGKYMQEAAVATPSGMVAVLGADETAVDALCAEAADGDILVPANFNAPGQIVISGAAAACERAVKVGEAKGLKTVALKVAGAFHSPLMQPAADRMAAELEKVPFANPKQPIYANVTADKHRDPASIKRLLVDQIVKPVRWEQTMQAMLALGEARWVELAPQRTLAGMLKRINRRLPIDSLSTADSLTAAAKPS
jgi:[acyl-carrier-protein] S-malonyltransferase